MARTVSFNKSDRIAESFFCLIVPTNRIDCLSFAVDRCILGAIITSYYTVCHNAGRIINTTTIGPTAYCCRIVMDNTVSDDTAVLVAYGSIFALIASHDTVFDNTTGVTYRTTGTGGGA